MSKKSIIRSWKDDEYRQSMSSSDQALLPANPAGITGLTDEELTQAYGGSIVNGSIVVTRRTHLWYCDTNCAYLC